MVLQKELRSVDMSAHKWVDLTDATWDQQKAGPMELSMVALMVGCWDVWMVEMLD